MLAVRHLWSFVVVIVVAVAFSVVSYEFIGTRPETMHTKMNNAWFIYTGPSEQNRTRRKKKEKKEKENRHEMYERISLSLSCFRHTRQWHFMVESKYTYSTRYYFIHTYIEAICMYVCLCIKMLCAEFKYTMYWTYVSFGDFYYLFTFPFAFVFAHYTFFDGIFSLHFLILS